MSGTKKDEGKAKGPATYFPSIEERYGHPIAYWKQIVRDSPLSGHKERVELLKVDHGMGHGHANAIVADTLREAAS